MLSKFEIEDALSELEDGNTIKAIEVLKHLLDKGNFYADMCNCDFNAKNNCKDCTCGLAMFLESFNYE